MPNDRQLLGALGEEAAASFLAQRGYRLLARRFRTRLGEIDLIAASPEGVLVFVEVKTRRGVSFGLPQESVRFDKQTHIARVAQQYLGSHAVHYTGCRFDVISVTWRAGHPPAIEHIPDAFRPMG